MYRPISAEYLTISRDISPFPLIYVVNWLHLISGHMPKKNYPHNPFNKKTHNHWNQGTRIATTHRYSETIVTTGRSCRHPGVQFWPEFVQRKKRPVFAWGLQAECHGSFLGGVQPKMRCCWFPTQLWQKIFPKKGKIQIQHNLEAPT